MTTRHRLNTMRRTITLGLLAAAASLTSALTAPPAHAQDVGDLVLRPTEPTPIMPFDDVRVGMKGYGLTVFAGTEIEAFPVEVVAVVPTETPQRGTLWIVCDDERMTTTGPVQGMSGSPIFLWPQGVEGTPGEGGTLAGAFAFGYPAVQYCLVGVQPIEYMREIAGRTPPEGEAQARAFGARGPASRVEAIAALRQSAALAADRSLSAAVTDWLLQAYGAPVTPPPVAPFDDPQAVRPLAIPLNVGNAATAAALRPLLQPIGFEPVALQASPTLAGRPHPGIDPQTTLIQPGSVLCVPYAWGDADLSGNGTVTDVLPDGTVLAFGHAMDSVGDTAVPMATGYVHFIVPSRNTSFKQAGSLLIQGTITRDEASGIACVPRSEFGSAPVQITVNQPGQPERTYRYRVVQDRQMTAPVAAALLTESLTTIQGNGPLSTARLTAEATFSNGRTIEFASAIAPADPGGLVGEVVPLLATILNNPFEPVELTAMTATIDVTDDIDAAELVRAWVDRPRCTPGDTVTLSAELRPYFGEPYVATVDLTLPDDLPAADYNVMLTDRNGYFSNLIAARPELMQIQSLDQLQDAFGLLADLDPTALYATLSYPGTGIAIAGQALPDLPGSRAALLGPAAGPASPPMQRMAENHITLPHIADVSIGVPLTVYDPAAPADQ